MINTTTSKIRPAVISKLKRQRGVSLIELMVSLVIGLIILLGITQIFTANRQTYTIQESVGRLQENGQYAINFIARHLRHAGYYPNPYVVPGNKTSHETLAFNGVTPVNGNEGGGAAADSLTVSYYTTGTDCVGNAPTGGFVLEQATTQTSITTAGAIVPGIPAAITNNTFTIAPGAAGRPALFCNGIEIAEGIENLQIRYGEDTDTDGFVDRYLAFDQVTDFSNVMIIQVALLAGTITEPTQEPDIKTYSLYGTIIDPVDDGRLRRVYTTTIRLRNRCSALQVTSGSQPCA